jgi:hypothetical protein
VQRSPLSVLPATLRRSSISPGGPRPGAAKKSRYGVTGRERTWAGSSTPPGPAQQERRQRDPPPELPHKGGGGPSLAQVREIAVTSDLPQLALAVGDRGIRNRRARLRRCSSKPAKACGAPRLWPIAIPDKLTARARASAPFWAVPSQKQRRGAPANELSNLRLERIHLETEFGGDGGKAESATKLRRKKRLGGMGAGRKRMAHGTFSKIGKTVVSGRSGGEDPPVRFGPRSTN